MWFMFYGSISISMGKVPGVSSHLQGVKLLRWSFAVVSRPVTVYIGGHLVAGCSSDFNLAHYHKNLRIDLDIKLHLHKVFSGVVE